MAQLNLWQRYTQQKTMRYNEYFVLSQDTHGNVGILRKSPSLAALKVVILITFSAASDENFVKISTFPSIAVHQPT